MKKKLFIFSNERINSLDGKFYCDNIDLKTTPEGLNKKFDVNLFGRKSNINRSHEIKIKRISKFDLEKADRGVPAEYYQVCEENSRGQTICTTKYGYPD